MLGFGIVLFHPVLRHSALLSCASTAKFLINLLGFDARLGCYAFIVWGAGQFSG